MTRLLHADLFFALRQKFFQVKKMIVTRNYSLKKSRAGALAIMPASASI